jgi:DNA-binding CsgD family transcriptional regulator
MSMIPFEEFLVKSNRADSVEKLVSIFLDQVKNHGLDRMIFCLLTDHKKIGLSAGVGHIVNYSPDWMDHYFKKNYNLIDPVISYCNQKNRIFTWEEMQERLPMTRDQKTCLHGGIEAGLNNGVCVPLWGPMTLAGVGLASSEKKDSFDGNLDLISAYCVQFYQAFYRLHEESLPPSITHRQTHNYYLTPKQKDVLTWAYKGKTDDEIATILNISYATVRYHLNKIYEKLHANDRVFATAKAMAHGLINP